MNKKNTLIGAAILACAVGTGVFAFNIKQDDSIVATVNNKPIYEETVKNQLKQMIDANILDPGFNFDTLDAEMKKNIVSSIIVSDLIEKKAIEAKVEDTQEYKNFMQFQKEQILQKIFIDQLASKNISNEQIEKKYKEFAAEESKKEEVKASQILFKDEKSAKEAFESIKNIQDFDNYQKKLNQSEDKNSSSDQGYFSKDQMPAEFSELAFSGEKDKILGPVKTDFGWHIIKVIDKRKVKVPSFDEMKDKIKNQLYSEFIQNYVKKLQEENKVEILIK